MKKDFQKLARFLKKIRIPSKVTFIIMGIASTTWLLIRVIPKPSRIHYPCMKATAPMAYSFIAYLLSLGTFTFFMKKARTHFKQSKYILAVMFGFIALPAGIIAIAENNETILASTVAELQSQQAGNEPVGEAKGIFPGRVVWEYDADATNENCSNSFGDYWYMDENTDQDIVNDMFSKGLRTLTGTTTDADAWDSIFYYYNRTHGNGNTGYTSGEKIVIKINLNGPDNNDINTSPQLSHALLDHLVNIAGVAEADIHIGDPNCSMNNATYNVLYPDFPSVNYYGNGTGLTSPVQSSTPVLKFSDGLHEMYIPQSYLDATYLINVPVFKKHHRSGISITSKNHFGSFAPFHGGAWDMHYALPSPDATGEATNGEYGAYRCFVDIMGHEHLGGKTILYLVDGLWGSTNWGHPPVKFRMEPFNNDWPSSLFISQDPVAVQSVCFDFLYYEFDDAHPTEGLPATDDKGPFSRFPGTDDFLHQAADPANWPTDPEVIEYDPEGDGSVLGSLGTHEHWNNATDKQYSRNLGTGNGIELKSKFVKASYTPGSSGLLSNKVNVIHIDSFDVKWFGTDSGISRYDDTNWDTINTDNYLLNNNVKDLAYERTGYGHEIWVATDSGLSVISYDVDGVSSATTYHTNHATDPYIINDTILAVGVDARHNRWIGTPAGLSVFHGSDWYDTTLFFSENLEWDTIPDVQITSMDSYDKDSMIYITAHGAGVIRYQRDDVDGFTGASAYGEDWTLLQSYMVNTVEINDTIQWIGSADGAYWHTGNDTKPRSNWDFFDLYRLSKDSCVNAIEVDDNGNVWFGTDSGLVIRTNQGWFEYTSDEGIVHPVVNDIEKDYSNRVWIATDGGVEFFSDIPGVPVSPEVPDQAINIAVNEINSTSAKITWTSGSGYACAVFVKAATEGTVSLLHGSYYLPDKVFGEGQEADGWYCVYNGILDSVRVSGLTPETDYRVMVCEYDSERDFEIYQTSTATDNPVNFATGPVSVNINEKDQFKVYPVPFNNFIYVDMGDETTGFAVSIYSLDGKLQKREQLSGKINEINTSSLPSGGYILQISGGKRSYSYKIVK
jgi:hypothetical protein